MSKTKNNTANAELNSGADMLKTGFGQTTKLLETAAEFGKGNVEAYVESATIAGEGFRTISTEVSMYSKKAIEESVAASKAIMGAKSIHEAIELQTSFAKMAFGAYVGQMKILNGLFVEVAKEALAPIQGRFEALSEITQSTTAA